MSELVESAGTAGSGQAESTIPAPVTETAPVVPAPVPLAEVIRAQREARHARDQEAARAKGLESELSTLKAELERERSERQKFEDDPVGYGKARGWTPEQQLLYGQSLLYDIVPDKADPSFRIKMFEDRQRREKAAESEVHRQRREQAEVEASQAQVAAFITQIDTATKTFEQGSYPESEAWFGEDRDTYTQSLIATAQNIARVANEQGRVADLSPAALAAALETEVARKMADRDARVASRKPKTVPAKADSGVQPAQTVSTRNMNGTGSPQPPPKDDKERVQRAIAAGFRSR